MNPRHHLLRTAASFAFTAVIVSSAAPAVAADPTTPELNEAVAEEDLKSLADPTILVRRAWLETEWNSYQDGSDNLEETLGTLWSWRLSPKTEWAVRFKIPYEWHLAGDTPGDANENGLGDIKVATGGAMSLSKTWRVGAGLDLQMPTAQNGMGDDVWKLQEIAAVAWDATPWLTFSPSMEYNQSVAERSGAQPQHNIEVFAPATFLLPRRWSFSAQYEIKVDFEDNNYVTQSAKFAVAKRLENVPLTFSLSFKKPFDTQDKDFQVNFAVTYFFQSHKPKPEEAP